ncbi:penicillin-binding protein 1A [Thiohalomonas denitrificans]|uniref:penicillin-binding protein 1A n=1 Tax=Thiohalomonas denitrificans TaxID=415747 RepID=UPI0026EEBD12|nr:penicillin-binding protein 1A [Thiohalomonas denitrificans]
MKLFFRLIRRGLLAAFVLGLLGVGVVAGAYLYVAPELPSIEKLKDVQLQVPLRIYSREGELIAEYGEMRRTPLNYEQIPTAMVQAILAAEDDRFFEHPGVDYQGIIRAVVHLIRTGTKGQGGSTITMQVARNFFLSSEKTYLRKLREIFLALTIERQLTKPEILELYLNKIYLGKRSYGVAAAAQVYYGKEISELEVPELAMIAGLPKAPSRFNPVANPERAMERRDYVLRRMHELDFISADDYRAYLETPTIARLHASSNKMEAPYLAEMVRAEMVEHFGPATYTAGYRVYTTVVARLQTGANHALREALLEYDRRHGYRGPEAQVVLEQDAGLEAWKAALEGRSSIGNLLPGVIVDVGEKSAKVYLDGADEPVELDWEGMAWARPYIDDFRFGPEPQKAADILNVGDIVRLEAIGEGQWRLAEVPEVSGALVSLRPDDGALQALVGGFDYYQSKFNRAIQAERQPGSNFKPFIYSAALANGFTPASVINDAPVVFSDQALETDWRPQNYSGRFFGPTRLREALVRSRNLVSIRLLRSMGVRAALEHVAKFGFDPKRLNRDLSMALGSSVMTPWVLARGYAVLANGGFQVEPYFIQRIEDADGNLLFKADPAVACLPCEKEKETEAEQPPVPEGEPKVFITSTDPAAGFLREPHLAPRSVDIRNIYLVTSMLQDVIQRGTGQKALTLGRRDLAGKTGTTNEQLDAWFSGFNRDVVTTAWVGFDAPRSMGRYETGSRAALPMWIKYMAVALDGRTEHKLEQPPGLVSVRIDPETGLLARGSREDAMFEIFRSENVPEQETDRVAADGENPGGGSTVTEQLF